jgi:hypothetical protein
MKFKVKDQVCFRSLESVNDDAARSNLKRWVDTLGNGPFTITCIDQRGEYQLCTLENASNMFSGYWLVKYYPTAFEAWYAKTGKELLFSAWQAGQQSSLDVIKDLSDKVKEELYSINDIADVLREIRKVKVAPTKPLC